MPAEPYKWTKSVCEEIKKKLDEYIDETHFPILEEFTSSTTFVNEYNEESYLHKNLIYDIDKRFPELGIAYSINRLQEKKVAAVQKGGMNGSIPSSFAIFTMKQYGWRDKQEIEQKSQVNHTVSASPELRELIEGLISDKS